MSVLLANGILYEIFLNAENPVADAVPSETAKPPVSVTTAVIGPEAVTAVTARPLFTPGRLAATQPDVVPAAVSVQATPRLAGIITIDHQPRAVFQASANEDPATVGVGEVISGWTVRSIADGSVTVADGRNERILSVSFDADAAPAMAARPMFPHRDIGAFMTGHGFGEKNAAAVAAAHRQ